MDVIGFANRKVVNTTVSSSEVTDLLVIAAWIDSWPERICRCVRIALLIQNRETPDRQPITALATVPCLSIIIKKLTKLQMA